MISLKINNKTEGRSSILDINEFALFIKKNKNSPFSFYNNKFISSLAVTHSRNKSVSKNWDK